MKPYRPSSVLVVAILQLCFGSLGLLGTVCGGAMQLAGGGAAFMPAGSPQAGQQKQMQQDMEQLLEEKIPHYKVWQYLGLSLGVMSTTMMVVSGIGLLKMRPWARWLTIVYACYNIASTIIGVVIAVTITLPATEAIFAEMGAKGQFPPQAAAMMGAMGPMMKAMTFGQLLLLAYPVVLLVVMFLPDVRAAFQGTGRKPVEEPDDEDDWEDDDEPEAPRGGIDPGAIKEPDPGQFKEPDRPEER